MKTPAVEQRGMRKAGGDLPVDKQEVGHKA